MSNNYSRFWIVALGLTLIMSQTLGQVDQPGSAQNEGSHFRSGFRMGRGAGVTEATPTPLARQTSQQRAPRFVPQGVRHRVPQDYATIQAAINASSHGDTVLVSEGKYMENIRYRGKAIVVGSLYLVDKDTTHIAKTIIDGSSSTQADSGSVVYFVNGEDTTSVLCGFTIQGGSGTSKHYVGSSSVPNWVRVGGGVFCDEAGARIVRNIIRGNRVVAKIAWGGGIEALVMSSFLPYLILEANRITDNYVESDTNEVMWGYGGGTDIAMNARIVGNVFERDSVVGKVGATGGGISFVATTSLPDGYIVGNVFRANLAFGTGGNGEGATAGGMLVVGTGNVTILDNLFESNKAIAANNIHQIAYGGGVLIDDGGYTGYGRKMIVNNQFLNNTVNSNATNRGGGLWIGGTLATVSGNRFANNATELVHEEFAGGGGVYIGGSSFRLENNLFNGNFSSLDGGALLINGWSPQIGKEQVVINNTFVNNHAASRGDGLRADWASYLAVRNNIFWDDTSSGGVPIFITNQIASVAYCDVKGGYAGTGNINVDPAFVAGDTMFHLMTNSPCIESGTNSMQIGGVRYYAPVNDYAGLLRPMPAGSLPDMGAQEEQVTMVAYAHDLSVQPLAPRKQVDTVRIRATVENPQHHSLGVTAFTKDLATGNILDSILLYNDGLHGDGLANDSTWGGMFVPTTVGVYGVSVRTVDGGAGTTRELSNAAAFATAGPVKYVGYYEISSTVPAPGTDLYLRIGIRHMGATGLITNVAAYLTAIDSLVDFVTIPSVTWGTLFPGDTIYYTSNFAYLSLGAGRAGGSTASFVMNISSNGFRLWRDTIRIVLTGVGGTEGKEKSLPTSYALEQNYPNPFNPATTIKYSLPHKSQVLLSVYNTLGQQVATLVQGQQEAGSYEVKFDGSGLASGIYFYRLQAGDYVASKKMLVLK